MASKRARDPFIVTPIDTSARDRAREWLEEAFGKLPDLSIRRLFGGVGVYAEDTIFGIFYADHLYLKTNERTRAAFIERGCDALRARSGTVLTAYYEVPPDVLDDEEELLSWARLALEAANREPERPRRKARPAKRAPRR